MWFDNVLFDVETIRDIDFEIIEADLDIVSDGPDIADGFEVVHLKDSQKDPDYPDLTVTNEIADDLDVNGQNLSYWYRDIELFGPGDVNQWWVKGVMFAQKALKQCTEPIHVQATVAYLDEITHLAKEACDYEIPFQWEKLCSLDVQRAWDKVTDVAYDQTMWGLYNLVNHNPMPMSQIKAVSVAVATVTRKEAMMI